MDLIDEFIARYTKEYDFYEQAGRLAARELQGTLQVEGIRSIVTYRAKSRDGLKGKCRKREQKNGPYSTVEEIFEDIPDLVGVRVALYFPGEHKQVDGIVRRLFDIQLTRHFPENRKQPPGKRFSGYGATHYRVQLNEQDLGETEKRYAIARIEIQVASVLMHAWSEVEHDLLYKPLTGHLSEDEFAILDELNGLVLAGEIALERLQRASERRVSISGRRFENHFDLAVHLLSLVPARLNQPVNEAGLGRVDLLFDLATRLELNTPDELSPYLGALHNDLETRPLAEQIIDALLAENPYYYEIYREIRERRLLTRYASNADRGDAATQIGNFLMHWIELEHLAKNFIPMPERRKHIMPNSHTLRHFGLLPPEMIMEFEWVRQLRNRLVHGIEPPSGPELDEASQAIQRLIAEMSKRFEQHNDGDPDQDEEPDE
ncbi:RelA/SpoT domain-containing protein [Micromonospora sp. NPDC049240]|uniref:GTP pyrophosphokinase n=1 Tax=Micromonospora sp. NPDC049240 TaxID=3155151 RepID=UPI003406A2A1